MEPSLWEAQTLLTPALCSPCQESRNPEVLPHPPTQPAALLHPPGGSPGAGLGGVGRGGTQGKGWRAGLGVSPGEGVEGVRSRNWGQSSLGCGAGGDLEVSVPEATGMGPGGGRDAFSLWQPAHDPTTPWLISFCLSDGISGKLMLKQEGLALLNTHTYTPTPSKGRRSCTGNISFLFPPLLLTGEP